MDGNRAKSRVYVCEWSCYTRILHRHAASGWRENSSEIFFPSFKHYWTTTFCFPALVMNDKCQSRFRIEFSYQHVSLSNPLPKTSPDFRSGYPMNKTKKRKSNNNTLGNGVSLENYPDFNLRFSIRSAPESSSLGYGITLFLFSFYFFIYFLFKAVPVEIM